MDSDPPVKLGYWTDHNWSDTADSKSLFREGDVTNDAKVKRTFLLPLQLGEQSGNYLLALRLVSPGRVLRAS